MLEVGPPRLVGAPHDGLDGQADELDRLGRNVRLILGQQLDGEQVAGLHHQRPVRDLQQPHGQPGVGVDSLPEAIAAVAINKCGFHA